jgi:surfactin synthase thioesterase subunit
MRLLFFILLISALSFGQDRNGISYQALILNPNGEKLPGKDNDHVPLINTDICLQFHIINGSGNYEYSESQSVTTDAYGMVNLVIGTGTPTGAITWDALAWSDEAKSLRVDIDFSATCKSFSLLSNQKLNFSPYSYYALYSNADDEVSKLQDIVNTNETASDTADATLQTNIDAVQADVDANETAANTAIAAVQADVDANETASDTADATLQTNIDAVQADVDANETAANTAIAAVQADVDANETASDTADATLQTNIDAVQADVDANETAANTAIAAVQADVDANETASDTADATLQTNIDAVQADVDANETAANTAIAAVQADVDANETASDTADATLQTNIDAVQADVDANETAANTAIAAVQADVDANETASDTADATLQTNIDAVQADVDANETAANTAIAAVQADVDANETASDTADATLQTNIDAVQADVDANETAANTAIAAVQADVDANETASDTADATLQNLIDALILRIETLEALHVPETASYTPNVQSGSGNFQESKYFKDGDTYFVFGNFSNANLDSPIKINIPTLTVFSNSNEVNGVISGYMMGMESVGGYIEAVPGTNHVNLSARGAHGMTFDTSGSYIFSYSDNSSGNSYTPSTINGSISLSEANYEIFGSTVFVNGNFSNGDFDGFGITADISIPTETVFSNSNEVNGVISGYMMDMESVGGYIEAVPGTSSVRLHIAGAHGMAFDSTGSFVFSYDIENNASTYTPTLSGTGTIETISYFTLKNMIVVNGNFSNLSDGATISLPLISSNFTSSTEVSGMITAKDYESFGGYIESVPSGQQVRFKLRGAHGQSTAQDGSFYFIYKP